MKIEDDLNIEQDCPECNGDKRGVWVDDYSYVPSDGYFEPCLACKNPHTHRSTGRG